MWVRGNKKKGLRQNAQTAIGQKAHNTAVIKVLICRNEVKIEVEICNEHKFLLTLSPIAINELRRSLYTHTASGKAFAPESHKIPQFVDSALFSLRPQKEHRAASK